MLVLDDDGGRATALAATCSRRPGGSPCTRARRDPGLRTGRRSASGAPPRLRRPLPDLGEEGPSETAGYQVPAAPGRTRRTRLSKCVRLRDEEARWIVNRLSTRRSARSSAVRQGLCHEDERPAQSRSAPSRPVARPRPRARHRRPAARPDRRGLRPGVLGQDDARLPRHRRGPAARRHRAFIDAEHAMDPAVREADRRQHRRPAGLAARHRRAGARDLRAARPLGRAGRGRHRLRRGADAEGGNRGRDGRHARRPAGAADEPGAAQARRHANRTDTICIFTNQLREKIGVMFGNPGDDARRPGARSSIRRSGSTSAGSRR